MSLPSREYPDFLIGNRRGVFDRPVVRPAVGQSQGSIRLACGEIVRIVFSGSGDTIIVLSKWSDAHSNAALLSSVR